MQALHRELIACINDLFSALELQPSTYARSVESVGTIVRNMQHLTRLMRPLQARLTLIETLKKVREAWRVLERPLQRGLARGLFSYNDPIPQV